MDYPALVDSFSKLGPALGAVVGMAITCRFLIELIKQVLHMFEAHGKALRVINDNMSANTNVIHELGKNVHANTKSTEKMVSLLEKSLVK